MPQKKNQFCAKNYAILSQVLVLLSYITAESWGIIHPVLKVGDLSPCPLCSDAYEQILIRVVGRQKTVVQKHRVKELNGD